MQVPPPAPEPFSWLRELFVPALFTIIGATLGLFATQIRDELQAKRAKRSFMRAIGLELDALGDQLDASLYEVKGSAQRARDGGSGPRLAASLRTSVFISQIQKLRDVDDSLMIAIIHFYSDLGTLEQVIDSVNALSAEYNRANMPSDQTSNARAGLLSSLRVLDEQISAFARRLWNLKAQIADWLKQPEPTLLDAIENKLELMTRR